MAINPIGSTSNNAMFDLWNQKIRANREDKSADGSDPVTISADGKLRLNGEQSGLNGSNKKAEEAADLEPKEDDDIYTRQIKQLLRQLSKVMEQIRKIEASSMPAEQKSEQLQSLNSQATQIMGQIQKVLIAKAKAAKAALFPFRCRTLSEPPVPIDPINGSSHSSMLDLWAQKIRANKEAKEAASTADPADPSASVRVNGGKLGSVAQSQESASAEPEDEYTRTLKQLYAQLARVMQQLKEAQNADLPSEQKLDQIQTLNTQAVNIQGMIAKVQSEQMKSAERARGAGLCCPVDASALRDSAIVDGCAVSATPRVALSSRIHFPYRYVPA